MSPHTLHIHYASEKLQHLLEDDVMTTTTPQKLQRGCNFTAQPGGKYCSTQCEYARSILTLKCACGQGPACAA